MTVTSAMESCPANELADRLWFYEEEESQEAERDFELRCSVTGGGGGGK